MVSTANCYFARGYYFQDICQFEWNASNVLFFIHHGVLVGAMVKRGKTHFFQAFRSIFFFARGIGWLSISLENTMPFFGVSAKLTGQERVLHGLKLCGLPAMTLGAQLVSALRPVHDQIFKTVMLKYGYPLVMSKSLSKPWLFFMYSF